MISPAHGYPATRSEPARVRWTHIACPCLGQDDHTDISGHIRVRKAEMFNSILVALEGGDASQQALGKAVDMARAAHARVTALFVVEHHLVIGDVILGCTEEQIFREFMHEEAERELRRAGELFTASGLEGETLMIDAAGEPVADVICRTIVSAKADLVVLGRHDPTVLEKIFGSLADKVLNKTAVSVLVVGSGGGLSDT